MLVGLGGAPVVSIGHPPAQREWLDGVEQAVGIVYHFEGKVAVAAHGGHIALTVGHSKGIANLHEMIAQPLRQEVGHIVLVSRLRRFGLQ